MVIECSITLLTNVEESIIKALQLRLLLCKGILAKTSIYTANVTWKPIQAVQEYTSMSLQSSQQNIRLGTIIPSISFTKTYILSDIAISELHNFNKCITQSPAFNLDISQLNFVCTSHSSSACFSSMSGILQSPFVGRICPHLFPLTYIQFTNLAHQISFTNSYFFILFQRSFLCTSWLASTSQ